MVQIIKRCKKRMIIYHWIRQVWKDQENGEIEYDRTQQNRIRISYKNEKIKIKKTKKYKNKIKEISKIIRMD